LRERTGKLAITFRAEKEEMQTKACHKPVAPFVIVATGN
jgi:hypothetical protein